MTKCNWQYYTDDGEPYYETDCYNVHLFSEGTPKENGYKFCPYCGKRIITKMEVRLLDNLRDNGDMDGDV